MRQRLAPSDLVLPADSFSNSYVLCLTLASLFSHASLAINSVAGSGIDLALASRSVSPTVVIASTETLANLHNAEIGGITSGLAKITYLSQTQTMSAGRMPSNNLLSKLLGPGASLVGSTPGKLRLILASDRAGLDSPVLSSAALSDLRIITHARISYALTAAQVAGAIAQTNAYDYRKDERLGRSHFGSPLSSVEVKLVDEVDQNVDGSTPTGEVCACYQDLAINTTDRPLIDRCLGPSGRRRSSKTWGAWQIRRRLHFGLCIAWTTQKHQSLRYPSLSAARMHLSLQCRHLAPRSE